MATKTFETKVNEAEWSNFRHRLARGALNFGFAVLADAQAEAPVRGGYRSTFTTATGAAGQTLVGGTLRRSLHAAAWLDGQPVAGSGLQDENGNPIPNDYPLERGIVVVVGTNSDYGAYVEMGTSRMEARPFLAPAWDANLQSAGPLIAAGMR